MMPLPARAANSSTMPRTTEARMGEPGSPITCTATASGSAPLAASGMKLSLKPAGMITAAAASPLSTRARAAAASVSISGDSRSPRSSPLSRSVSAVANGPPSWSTTTTGMRLMVGVSLPWLKLPVTRPMPMVSTSGPAMMSSTAAQSRNRTLTSFHMMVRILFMASIVGTTNDE